MEFFRNLHELVVGVWEFFIKSSEIFKEYLQVFMVP